MNKQFLITQEDGLNETYQQKIIPFWQHSLTQASFIAKDGLNIAYAYVIHPQAKGSIVISSGRIEAYIKYKELVFDLYHNGYSVFIHDHRGQGQSGRMVANPHLGYVDDFNDYVDDFELFMQRVVLPRISHQPVLLGHSMGCAIGALYCLHYPLRFSKAVFSAPMFGIRPALPKWFATLLVKSHFALGRLLSKQYGYFFGQQDYVNHDFVGNNLTHSVIRYDIFRQEYAHNPQVQLGGVSGHWLHAAAQAMDEIEDTAEKFPIPSLVIQAGGDEVVDNRRQRKVVAKMPRSELTIIEHAKHELLMEQDPYRIATMQAALTFIAKDTQH